LRIRIAISGLAAIGVVVMMMIRAGKLGSRMFVFVRGMFAGDRVGGMGARVGAVVRQSVVTCRGAARTGRRAATAQTTTRAEATSTHISAAAMSATGAATPAMSTAASTATTMSASTATTAAATTAATTTTGA
jgi:hypothetical protein